MNRVMRKPPFCIVKNKGADQLLEISDLETIESFNLLSRKRKAKGLISLHSRAADLCLCFPNTHVC